MIRLSESEAKHVLKGRKRSKYQNKRTEINGKKFDSKAEAARYEYNLLRIQAGELYYQLMQCPFHLPGGITYRVDFMEVYPDGRIEFVDVKGYVTDTFKLKKKQVESLYPVIIRCIKLKKGYEFTDL